MSVVDDYGRYEADPVLIRARCFPRQLERWPVERIQKCMDLVSAIPTCDKRMKPLVIIYEVEGSKYLEIQDFQQRTRTESRYPRSIDGQVTARATSSSSSPTTTPAATGGFIEFPKPNPPKAATVSSSRFTEFWERYPLKTGKPVTFGVWAGLVSPKDEEAVFACLGRYLESDQVARGTVKLPNNWLHDCARDKWESDWPKPQGKKGPRSEDAQAKAIAEAMKRADELENMVEESA